MLVRTDLLHWVESSVLFSLLEKDYCVKSLYINSTVVFFQKLLTTVVFCIIRLGLSSASAFYSSLLSGIFSCLGVYSLLILSRQFCLDLNLQTILSGQFCLGLYSSFCLESISSSGFVAGTLSEIRVLFRRSCRIFGFPTSRFLPCASFAHLFLLCFLLLRVQHTLERNGCELFAAITRIQRTTEITLERVKASMIGSNSAATLTQKLTRVTRQIEHHTQVGLPAHKQLRTTIFRPRIPSR